MSNETPIPEILLERKAEVVRSRLLRTLDQLDRRKKEVTHTAETLQAVSRPATAAVAGTAVAFGVGALLLRDLLARRRDHRARHSAPLRRLALALAPPPPPRPSFAAEALRKVALSVVVLLATEAAKRTLRAARADVPA